MVYLLIRNVSAFVLYVFLVFEESVKAFVNSFENNDNNTVQYHSEFDFREMLKENRLYPPLKDNCRFRINAKRTVEITDIPYQILIREGTRGGDQWLLVCAGTIIARQHVLTAAHCFNASAIKNLKYYRVVAGTSHANAMISKLDRERLELRQQFEEAEVWRKILKCFVHLAYNPTSIDNDLAVLKLEHPMTYSTLIKPIPMLKYTDSIKVVDNGLCAVSGFGLMHYRDPAPRLRLVCLPVILTDNCEKIYAAGTITHNHICAGGWDKDNCQGDPGGPVSYKGYLIGIVSYTGRCKDAPAVYTSLASYTDGRDIPFTKLTTNQCAMTILTTPEIMFLVFLAVLYNLLFIYLFSCI